jgi:hypothetical protein
MILNKDDKQAVILWDDFLDSIRKQTSININETKTQKAARIKKLETPGNQEEWFKYYFPNYCFCEPADFHKKSTIIALNTPRLYQRRAWARGLAKSTRRMMEKLYKKFVQRKKLNLLLCSYSEGNAIRLLAPYRANLEANQRLINDYGTQIRIGGKWAEEEFITRDGSSFRAVGIGQNPRGARLEELRVTDLIFDDADSQEVCDNPERLDKLWDWVEGAAIPTVEMSKDYQITFDNNIIGEDSMAVRAAEKATHVETVNWRDENGVSTWKEKNTEKDIDDMEAMLSYETVQKEGYNNPVTQGKTFKEMVWGQCPPKEQLSFMLAYADPSTSNKDKPSIKSRAHNSSKCIVILGYKDMKFYVYKCFLDHTSNHNFIQWAYACKDEVGNKTAFYLFIENNKLQDPFYEQVFLPLIFEEAKKRNGDVLPITPDTREKPE